MRPVSNHRHILHIVQVSRPVQSSLTLSNLGDKFRHYETRKNQRSYAHTASKTPFVKNSREHLSFPTPRKYFKQPSCYSRSVLSPLPKPPTTTRRLSHIIQPKSLHLRSKPLRITREHTRLSNIRQTQKQHDHPLQSNTPSPMGHGAVTERIDITRNFFDVDTL